MKQGYDEGIFLRNGQSCSLHCLKEHIPHAGECTGAHYHKYCELLYGIDCDLTVWIEDYAEPLKSGDLFFINPNQTHRIYSERKNNQYFVIKFFPEILRYDGQTLSEVKLLFSTLYSGNTRSHLIPSDALNRERTLEIFRTIFREWESETVGHEFLIRGELLRIFSEFLRRADKKKEDKLPSSVNDETVSSILSSATYIIEHFDTVTEQEAAAVSHMSYSYFSRMFKKVMGKSFSRFVNDFRIDEAKRLLLISSESVTEIAQHTGFSTSSHLISAFKQKTGVTPHQYRTKIKELYQSSGE